MPDGYFVLPRIGSGTDSDPYRPKYMYQSDGQTLRSEVEKFYGSEEIEKGGSFYFACRVFADTQGDLDNLAAQSDAYEIPPADIRDALNGLGLFPTDLTAFEWALLIAKFVTFPTETE